MQWLQETFNNLTTSETEGSREGSSAKAKSEPQKDGQLSREQLFDFFTKASKEMQAEEFRRKLKDARLLKQDVEDRVTDMQKEVFKSLGIDGEYGIQFLSQVSTVYKSDDAVMAELLRFASLEEDTLDEAEMSEADYEQKQRLLDLAKAHTAQLMSQMDALPPESRQAFLQSQLKVAEQLRQNIAAGNAKSEGEANLPAPLAPQDQGFNSMSPEEMRKFFQQQRGST